MVEWEADGRAGGGVTKLLVPTIGGEHVCARGALNVGWIRAALRRPTAGSSLTLAEERRLVCRPAVSRSKPVSGWVSALLSA
jgi:hypothetical protein